MRVQRVLGSVMRRVAIAAVALGAGLAAPSSAGALPVTFLQGEQTVTIDRPAATTSREVLDALLAGPTPAELATGVRTYVPRNTAVRSLVLDTTTGVATVDLSLAFIDGDDPDSLRARLTQLVGTLTGPTGMKGVRVLVGGGVPLGIFPGVAMTATLTPDYLSTPDRRAPTTTSTKPPKTGSTLAAPTSTTRQVQQRLAELGYLLPGDVDGRFGPVTQAGVIAFQKWEGLKRSGVIDGGTRARLSKAKRPTPRLTRGPGNRTEVLLDKQVTLAITNDKVVRTLHVSTGAPATPTPPGAYKVYAQYTKWWSVPFREWLLWASPFNGGIAFHQLAEVPVYPASHGCVRLTAAQAPWLYRFLKVGTPVEVLAR